MNKSKTSNKVIMIEAKYLKISFAILLCYLFIEVFNLKEPFAAWMTYRDFDVASQRNFIYYLLPGTSDVTSQLKYQFQTIHWGLVIGVFFGLFPVMGLLRLLKISKQKGRLKKQLKHKLEFKRGLIQLSVFIIARLGILRVAGVCKIKRSTLGIFPFINCQSCELATGACPIGTLHMAMLKHSFPALTLFVLSSSAIIFGRFICGWLCPFGFLSDIIDRFSRHKKLPKNIHYLKYVGLTFLTFSLAWAYFFPKSNFIAYCAFLCPAGFFYGVLPFYATSAKTVIANSYPYLHSMFYYHIASFVVFMYFALRYAGRIFCIALCPLGAFYSFFNRFALVRILFEKSKCNSCKRCYNSCPMQTDISENNFIAYSSCIACGKCVDVCSQGALSFSTKTRKIVLQGVSYEPK